MSTNTRTYTLLILTILALGLLTSIPIHASTGNPVLGAVNDISSPSSIVLALNKVSLKAGSNEVEKIDNAPATGYFAIVFAIGSTDLVTFSGAQFDLYISKDGYSTISPDDKKYASGFLVSDLGGSIKKVTKTNPLLKGGKADFYIGSFSNGTHTFKVLIGPIPFDVTPDYKFIKIFDGTATAVAVSKQIVEILPAIELVPAKGPAGALVTLRGVALQPNKLLNLTYGNLSAKDKVFAQVQTDENGKFTYSWNIRDLKASWTGSGPVPKDIVNIYVWYNATGTLISTIGYEEYRRAFVQLKSINYGHEALPFTNLLSGAGNETLTLEVYVFDKVVVAGAWWNPTSPVIFTVGGKTIGSVTPNATGFFNVTLSIPELTVGEHAVKVTNAGVTYVFYIRVYPTLVLTPVKGYVGDVVEAKVYGFPAKVLVGIWWYGYYEGSYSWRNLVNGTTGADGRFNITVTFKVPNDYGGDHDVIACYPWNWSLCDVKANATFTILPKLMVVPSVFSNDGSEVRVIGTGFDPGSAFTVNIDNQFIGLNNDYYWTTPIWVNATGNIEIVFIAAGFRPGLHVISLYPEADEPPYKPVAYALFTVTGEGDPIYTAIQTLGAKLAKIEGDVAVIKTDVGTIKVKLAELEPVITEIRNDVAVIKTKIGTIEADVAAIKSLVQGNNALLLEIRGSVAVIKTDVGTIKADVAAIKPVITSIDGNVVTIKTDVGTIKADVAAIKPVITSIDGNVVTIKTDVGTIKGTIVSIDGNIATIKTDVGTIKADLGNVKSTLEGLSMVSTAVWLAVVFSLISVLIVVYLVVVIRRKIAG